MAREHPPPATADPGQEWQGAAPRTQTRELLGTTHHHNQRAPARSGGESHPSRTGRSSEGPPTATTARPQPGVAGNRTQNSQPGVMRDQPQHTPATPTQTPAASPAETREDKQPETTDTPHTHTRTPTHVEKKAHTTPPTPPPTQTLQRHKTHKARAPCTRAAPETHTTPKTPHHPTPRKRATTTAAAGGPQLGVAGNRNQDPQPGLARDHKPPPPADPGQQWRGTAPRTLGQEWRGNTHHHRQRTPAKSGGEPNPRGDPRLNFRCIRFLDWSLVERNQWIPLNWRSLAPGDLWPDT